MSQHSIVKNTHKKLTHLAVALILAASPLAVPALASATGDTGSDDTAGYEASSTSSTSDTAVFPEKKTMGEYTESSDDGYTPYDQENDTATGEDGESSYEPDHKKDWQKDDSHTQGQWQDKYKKHGYHKDKTYDDTDKNYEQKESDDKHIEKEKPKEHVKEKPQPAPVKHIEKTEVIVKPTEVRHEVSQHVNQETNVTVERAAEVVQPRPIVREKTTIVPVAVTEPTTPKPMPQEAEPEVPVIEGGKGALEETGSETKSSMLAGLSILGALGTLSILRRRKNYARE